MKLTRSAPIAPGDLVWREHEAGVWRVIGLQERVYSASDYRPLGARVGDPAPPWALLERVLDGDFKPPLSAARGRAPRRAGAPVTALRKISKDDLHALCRRILQRLAAHRLAPCAVTRRASVRSLSIRNTSTG